MRLFSLVFFCFLLGALNAPAHAKTKKNVTQAGATLQLPKQTTKTLLRNLRATVRRHIPHLRADRSLNKIAHKALKHCVGGQQYVSAGDFGPVVERFVRESGVTDADISTLLLEENSIESLQRNVIQSLSHDFTLGDLNRFGLALRIHYGKLQTLLLLTKRVISFRTFSPRYPINRMIRLEGEVHVPIHRAEWVNRYPDGRLSKTPLTLNNRNFEVFIDSGKIEGQLNGQLVIERGHGPEIAGQINLGIGQEPQPNTGLEPLWKILRSSNVEQTSDSLLRAFFASYRTALSLDLPKHSEKLSELAQSHAYEIVTNRFFGHHSPTTGTLDDRLRKQGIGFIRAVENIAIGGGPHEVFSQWLRSPSHEANLREGDMTEFGVGTVRLDDNRICTVMVLLQTEETADLKTLTSLAHQKIDIMRTQRKLPNLRVVSELSEIARKHSEKIVDHNNAQSPPPNRPMLDEAFDITGIVVSGVDIMRGNSLDIIKGLEHFGQQHQSVGIGIVRTQAPKPELVITVLYGQT